MLTDASFVCDICPPGGVFKFVSVSVQLVLLALASLHFYNKNTNWLIIYIESSR